jgi:hypothetical protein
MKRRIIWFFALLLTTLAASAQTSRGTVSGLVTDQTGAVIPNATVTLTNTETTVSRTTVTNDEGLYRFDAVDLGTYNVKFTAAGFGPLAKNNVIITANQVARVDAELAAGGQEIAVDITAESAALLQTEAPVRGGNIESQRIAQLPIATRNPAMLALTLPGVSTSRFGFGTSASANGTSSTFSVNGSRGRSNNFLIDGTENNDISVAGQAFQIKNPDAVQEVSVQTSNYDAEFGRAGGAVVNTITKSGTNEYHGTLAFTYDTTADDAITNTQSLSPAIQLRGKPPYGTEQFFSGTLGGPLHLPRFGEGGPSFFNGRDRTFFFVAYQNQRQASNSTANVVTLSPRGRASLRSLFAPGVNRNADIYLAVTDGVDATGQFFTQELGLGRPAIEFGTAVNSFQQQFTEPQFQLRIDHKIGESNQLSGRYLWGSRNNPIGGATLGLPGFTTSEEAGFQNFLLSDTHVFSPAWTNELRLAYNRILFGFPLDPTNPLGLTLPSIRINGITDVDGRVTNIGIQTNLPQGRVANNYVLQNTTTHVRGNHTFRFGFDLLEQRSRQFAPIVERGFLRYDSGGGFSAFANFIDDFGGSGPSTGSANRDFGSPRYYPELFRQAYFFQDRWRATETFTLTLGLRYENFGNPINTLRTAAFAGLFNVDPVTFDGPYNKPSKVKDDNNNFAPTVGIAWTPSARGGWLGSLLGDKQTVIRSGYQIGYDSFFNNIASNAATSTPNVVATQIVSTVSAANPRGLSNLTSRVPTVARPFLPTDGQTLADPNLVNPYYQRWSLGVQRSLPFNVVVDASYVGTKGTKLFMNEDRNPPVPAAQRVIPQTNPPIPASRLTNRLDALQGARTIRSNSGSSIYHAGQLQVSRRFSTGLNITGAYTWSKLIDNNSEIFASTGIQNSSTSIIPHILGGERNERAVSLFDRTHRAVFTYVYPLPFLRDQRGFAGRLFGGWEISGVTQFESGVPFTVANGEDSNGVGGNNDRPDFNPNGRPGVRAKPNIATAANPGPAGTAIGAVFYTNPDDLSRPNPVAGRPPLEAFIDPSTARYIGLLANTGRTGTLGRNTERTKGINNFDFNLAKRVRLTETTNFEFRAEFFNVFNHPQYGSVSASPFAPTASGPGANVFTTAAGQFLRPEFGDGGGRVIRYQVKLLF